MMSNAFVPKPIIKNLNKCCPNVKPFFLPSMPPKMNTPTNIRHIITISAPRLLYVLWKVLCKSTIGHKNCRRKYHKAQQNDAAQSQQNCNHHYVSPSLCIRSYNLKPSPSSYGQSQKEAPISADISAILAFDDERIFFIITSFH